MKKYLFLSLYEFLLFLSGGLLLIAGKNEIFASLSYKVENIKRDIAGDVCAKLNFSTVLNSTKVFGFYNPLQPLENNSSVIEFIKNIRIDYLNYIVDISTFETNKTIMQELNDLRNNSDLKELQILLSITSSDLNIVKSVNSGNSDNGPGPTADEKSFHTRDTSETIKTIVNKVKGYKLDGVNIENDCNSDLNMTLGNINSMRSVDWNPSWIITFTMNANETLLNDISNIQKYVNYTIIQAFYLDPDENYSAPLDNDTDNVNYAVTFNSLFKKLNKELKGNFKKLIWGFDLSGIMKNNPGSITTGLRSNDDKCLNSEFFIWPWKEIRNISLTDMCVANNNSGWVRSFINDTNSTILSNQLGVSNFSYEDPESLFHKFNWVTSNKFAGISIANLAFDSTNNSNSILKFIKSTSPKDNVTKKTETKTENNSKKVIIGVVIGCILFVIGLLIGFLYCSMRRKRQSAIKAKSIQDKNHYLDQPVVDIPLSLTPPPPPSPTSQQNSIVPKNGVYASALYDFEGKEDCELSFKKGDLIEVIEGDGPNSWWKGKINGTVGDFPGNYVVIK